MQTIQIRPAGPLPVEQMNRKTTPLTLADVEAMMAETDRAVIPIKGSCLEGAGVQDGGWVAVDLTHRPAPPRFKAKGGEGDFDLCLCYATFPGAPGPTVMLKRYDGRWGDWQMVSTCYRSMWNNGELRLNCAMPAERIFGVIIASWAPDGTLLWERDPGSFPVALPDVPTIRGEVEPV